MNHETIAGTISIIMIIIGANLDNATGLPLIMIGSMLNGVLIAQ